MTDEKILQDLERQAHQVVAREGHSEARKTWGQVFDRATLVRLTRLISHRRIETLEFPIAVGKEANVFCAGSKQGLVAIKIYRTATTSFRHMGKYIDGDPRFHGIRKNRRALIRSWALKEFKNLKRAQKVGIRVPNPLFVDGNIVGMEFLGDATGPAPTFQDLPPEGEEAARAAEQLRGALLTLVREANLVHADLSPYNVLRWEDEYVIIDWAQGVLLRHPNAREFLQRDIEVMARAFRRLGVESDPGADLKRALAPQAKGG